VDVWLEAEARINSATSSPALDALRTGTPAQQTEAAEIDSSLAAAAQAVKEMSARLQPKVIAVGSGCVDAGSRTATPDWFSNVGDWIDVWVNGSGQVGRYRPDTDALATWSGTSFAAARLTGLLAQQNSWTPASGPPSSDDC
jgi:hypothetical protein